MHIGLFTRSLAIGGAQRQLLLLAREFDKLGHLVTVVTLYTAEVPLDTPLPVGVRHVILGKRSRYDLVDPAQRLVRLVRDRRVDVLYSLLSAASTYAVAIRPLMPRTGVVVGLRSTRWPPRSSPARVASEMLQRLSTRRADAVIANSEEAAATARRWCGRPSRVHYIANGFDTKRFVRSEERGLRFRRALGIPADSPLVGIVARLDPVKRHELFVAAAARVRERCPTATFVAIGPGSDERRRELERLSSDSGLGETIRWLPIWEPLWDAYSAMDVLVLCSEREGFPNVVGESMACGVVPVVTRVGQAPELVSGIGAVVEDPGPYSLASSCLSVLRELQNDDPTRLRIRARSRVEDRYSAELVASRTLEVLESVHRGIA